MMQNTKRVVTEFDSKLLLLLALDSIGVLSMQELCEILINNEYLDYFSIALALQGLVDSQSVNKDDIYYHISQKGKDELNMFITRIPASVQRSITLNALEFKKQVYGKRTTTVFYSEENEKAFATIYLYKHGIELIRCNYSCPVKQMYFHIHKKLKRNREKIYNFLLQSISDAGIDMPPKEEPCIVKIDQFAYLHCTLGNVDEELDIQFLLPNADLAEAYVQAWNKQGNAYFVNLKKLLLN